MYLCAVKSTLVTLLILLGSAYGIHLMGGLHTAPESAKVALGRKLFSEKILSADSSVSCASCHKPGFAFADTAAFSLGIHQTYTKRNTPSVLNMVNRPYFFWDGRAATLEAQALMPIENPDEMGLPIEEAVHRLNQSPTYVSLFKSVFRSKPNRQNLAAAFAAFERTLETVDSKFDDWSNDEARLSASEERGRQLFIGSKAGCFDCHFMEDFTDDAFRSIGLFDGVKLNDSGRFLISRNPEDIGRFKTPGLRNVALTAPYMHNGMFNTLEEVIDYYDDPLKVLPGAKFIDSLMPRRIGLTAQEKKDLIAFLHTLTDRKYLPTKAHARP